METTTTKVKLDQRVASLLKAAVMTPAEDKRCRGCRYPQLLCVYADKEHTLTAADGRHMVQVMHQNIEPGLYRPLPGCEFARDTELEAKVREGKHRFGLYPGWDTVADLETVETTRHMVFRDINAIDFSRGLQGGAIEGGVAVDWVVYARTVKCLDALPWDTVHIFTHGPQQAVTVELWYVGSRDRKMRRLARAMFMPFDNSRPLEVVSPN